MSEPSALVCVRNIERGAPSAQRWRRRGVVAPHVSQPPSSAPGGVQPSHRGNALRTAFILALLAAGAGAGATLAMSHAGDSAFSRRVAAGCEELEPCRSLEAEAERRMDGCSLWCGEAAAEHRAARLMRYRAEERLAVRAHYQERDRAERLEQQTQRARQVDDWQRREAARSDQAERERQHQLELERLRQAHVDRRIAEERQRRQGYYSALGPEGRTERLKHCLVGSERCDALVLDLLEAAAGDSERRKLAELNEGVRHPPPPKATPPAKAHEQPASEELPQSSIAPTAGAPQYSPRS
jgi:hypothetical protein